MVPRPSFIPPFLSRFTRASLNSHAAPGALGVIPLLKARVVPGGSPFRDPTAGL